MAVTAGSGPKTVRKDAGRRVLPQTNRRPAPFFFGVKARFFFRRKRNGPCPCRAGTPRRDSAPRKVGPCPPRAATGRPYTGRWRAESSRPTDGHSAWRVWEAAPHGRAQCKARLGSRAPETKTPCPTNGAAAPTKPKPCPHRPGPPRGKQLQLVIYQKKITFRIQKARKKGRPAGRPFRLCQEAQPLGSSFPSGSSRTLAEAHRPARA